jgi:hypothetical protein
VASVGILKLVIGTGTKARAKSTSGGKIKARATVEGCTPLEVAALREKATNADRGVDPGSIITG